MGRATNRIRRIKKNSSRRNIIKIGKRLIKLKYVISPSALASFGRKLTHKKKDLVFIITGYPGEGKSVLAIHLAKKYDRRFSYDRNLIYSRSELVEKVEKFPPSAFIIDEAINILYKREWNKSSQKDMVKLLNICRSKGHMIIFVQPDFEDMDKDIRKKRLRCWIDVVKRGVGVLYKPIKSLGGGSDPWNLEKNDRLIKFNIKKLGLVEGYLEGAAKTENFQNIITWENISKEEYARYEEIKDRKKYAEEDTLLLTEKEAKKMARKELFKILAILGDNKMLKRGVNSMIANILGISSSSVGTYLRQERISQNLNKPKASKEEREKNSLRI